MRGTQAQTDQTQQTTSQAADLAPFTLPEDYKPFTMTADPQAAGGQPGLVSRVGKDLVNGLSEAPAQALRGAEKALNETSQTLVDATASPAEWLNKHVVDLGTLTPFKDGSVNPLHWWSPTAQAGPEKAPAIPSAVIPGQARTVTGSLVEGASQFATGMVLAGRYLKTFGLGGVATGAAGAVAKAGIAGATAFDPHEDRLSNLIQANPTLANPVMGFLASRPDDGEAMGRFKSALENAGLGLATEGFSKAVQAIKLARSGDHAGAAEAAAAAAEDGPKVQSGASSDAKASPTADPSPVEGEPAKPTDQPTPPQDPQGNVGKPAEAPAPSPVVNLQPEDVSALRERMGPLGTSYDPGGDMGGPFKPLNGIRTDLIQHDGDLDAALDSLRISYAKEMQGAIGGDATGELSDPVRSFAQVRQNADAISDMVGSDPQLMLQRMAATHDTVFNLDAELRAHGDFMATIWDRIGKMADVVDGAADPASMGYADHAQAAADMAKHWQLFADVQARYRGEQTNVARALNAFKMGSKVNPALSDAITNAAGMGPSSMKDLARRVRMVKDDPFAGAKLTRPGFVSRFLNAGNEYWINAILSGPKTHAVNMLGNTMSSALLPAERMMSGAIRLATSGGRQEFTEGALHYVGMIQSVNDAVRLAAKALKAGDSLLTPGETKLELGPSISASGLGMRTDSLAANLVNGLGAVVRLPSRMLTAEDEFFKQLVYRGAVRAQAIREGLNKGLTPFQTTEWAFHIQDALDKAATDTGQGTNEKALAMAKRATFQQDLQSQTWASERTIGETLSDAANNHPMVRLILPFVKTPTNLLRFTWERTPILNMARKQYSMDLFGRNGPEARADAWAKMMTGGTLLGSAIGCVLSGTITGAGPSDTNARKALMATGWQPYSWKQTAPDGSVNYRAYDKLDPFGMFFGLAADFAEVGSAHSDQDLDQMAISLMQAVAKNLDNKSYLSGIINSLSALTDPEHKAKGYMSSLAGSFIPAFMTQELRNDPYMREARTLVDGMRRRTPGYSDTLDPQRNILGQPVTQSPSWGPDWLSPVADSTHPPGGSQPVSADWKEHVQPGVKDEIARQLYLNGHGISPPPTKHGQIDLTQFTSPVTGKTSYDRWQELTGTVHVNGKTLEQSLSHLIGSSAYQNHLTDADLDGSGSRLDAIRKYVGAYRELAKSALFKEQPDLGRQFYAQDTALALKKVQHPQ